MTETPSLQTETPGDPSKISFVSGERLLFNARMPKAQRMMMLKALLSKGYTDKQLASMLKCTERTIYTYKMRFFESEDFWLQVNEEIYALLHDDQVPKLERLRALITLKKTHMMAIQVDKSFEGSAPVIRIVDDVPSPKVIT